MGAAAVQASPVRAGEAAAPTVGAEAEWRNKQPEMRYRRLGRTGFMISEIVCGGDPISPTKNRHVALAIEMGLMRAQQLSRFGCYLADGERKASQREFTCGANVEAPLLDKEGQGVIDSMLDSMSTTPYPLLRRGGESFSEST